jgi:hypothetical protein
MESGCPFTPALSHIQDGKSQCQPAKNGETSKKRRLLARRGISPRARAYIFCARMRTTDVGAREMPRSVVTAGQVCKEGKFAEKIARLANLNDATVPGRLVVYVKNCLKFAGNVHRQGPTNPSVRNCQKQGLDTHTSPARQAEARGAEPEMDCIAPSTHTHTQALRWAAQGPRSSCPETSFGNRLPKLCFGTRVSVLLCSFTQ